MIGALTGLTAVVSFLLMVLSLAISLGLAERDLAERIYQMWALTVLIIVGYVGGPWFVGVIG